MCPAKATAKDEQPTTVFLAGPLGFEPRQSAPKALDLPLVDGPVELTIYEVRFSIENCVERK
jgi:hypothetical protein